MKETKGAKACMHACIKVTNYHFLNRELIPNKHCTSVFIKKQHLDRDHQTYQYYMVRREMQWPFGCSVELEKKL